MPVNLEILDKSLKALTPSLPNLANEMEAMQQIQADYIDVLVSETNMTKKQLKKLLERKVNVYLSAEEAVELGIADEII